MAKKKRKHYIKLHNKIRELFNNQTFDDGVTTLSDDELLELVLVLGISSDSLGRNVSIASLRRAWSEGGYNYRKAIVDHLSGKKELNEDRQLRKILSQTDKVIHLLEDVEHTREEENEILASFVEVKEEKITKQKIENKLQYIRYNKKITNLEKLADVIIDNEHRLQFIEDFNFDMKEYTFKKKLLCMSVSMSLDSLMQKPDSEILNHIENEKQSVYTQKQEEINTFICMYNNQANPLIDEKNAYNYLKRMKPENMPCSTMIPIDDIEKIFTNIINDIHTYETESHFIFEEYREHLFLKRMLKYKVSVSYEKEDIYCSLWKNDPPSLVIDLDIKSHSLIENLNQRSNELLSEMESLSIALDLNEDIYADFILNFASAQIENSRTLKISDKNIRAVLFHFREYIAPLLLRQKREELLAKSIRDFKSLFGLARSLKREIIFHVGPTNSGKTYSALESLADASTGYYLSPLRLLALEGYESLKSKGLHVSLITGEEEIIDDESTHISSTIEMLNSSVDVDVCVIDEIQMINDRDRGWAWANALIGAPAKKVILTGSADAIDAVKELCEYLEESLEIIHFERKNPLYLDDNPTSIREIKPGTALIAFSRKDVLSLKQQISDKYDVSVIYGNLSPEVRREEAKRFREGMSSVLVATDAISMGLNLPIKNILFSKDNKFDGLRRRDLLPSEVQQIAGRAGRYGLEESGHIGAINHAMLKKISTIYSMELPNILLPVSVMASLEHATLISEILQSDNIADILGFFADNMEFDGPFVAANMDSMLEMADIVDKYKLDIKTKYYLSCAPASISSAYIESVFKRYIKQIEKVAKVEYLPPRDLPAFAQTNEMLLNAEDRVREISLYLWLSFKFPDLFQDSQKAIKTRYKLNAFIEKSLRSANFSKKCSKCEKQLNFSYRYSICDKCYTKQRHGYKRVRGKRR